MELAIYQTFHLSNLCVSNSSKQLSILLSCFSLENTLQVALGKCLGTAGTLRLPLVMPYRCIAPGEKESVNFTLKYNASKGPQGKPCVLVIVSVISSAVTLT